MKTKKLVYTALVTALICILSPLSISFSYIPISLATFAIMLSGMVFGARIASIATILYLIIGAIGVPVFAGYSAGIGVIAGVTGGYLVGYVALAYITGWVSDVVKCDSYAKRNLLYFIGMIIGTAVLYLIGTIYFEFLMQLPLWTALMSCVIPFIPGDLIKIIAVILISDKLKKAIGQ